MRTYLVTLERRIHVEFDAESSSQAINGALYASSSGEFNDLWENASAKFAGISDVTLPTNEEKK